jgi:hypothetical protein
MADIGLRSFHSRYFNAFRLASYLLVLYTLGHTLGAVIETPQFGASSNDLRATGLATAN